MEGKILMATRRHVTNKLHTAHTKSKKAEKTRTLNMLWLQTGWGRSSYRRMLVGVFLPNPKDQVDQRRLRPKGFDYYSSMSGPLWVIEADNRPDLYEASAFLTGDFSAQ
jgi:hypothetical protein